MHSCEKNGLKDTILQKLEKSYTTLSTWQQFWRGAKEKEGNLPVQLSENWQNYMWTGIIVDYSFSLAMKTAWLKYCILLEYGQKKANICVYVNIA